MRMGFEGGRMKRACGGLLVAVLMLGLVLGVAGCSKKQAVLFDGQAYKASVSAARGERRDFTVTVRDAAGNLDAAQRAGRYEGVVYCARSYGGSPIEWGAAGVADPGQLVADAAGALVLQGRCSYR